MPAGDGTAREDYNHPFKVGWKLLADGNGGVRPTVAIWTAEAVNAAGGSLADAEPLATIPVPAAESLADELGVAAKQATAMAGLLPIVIEVGGNAREFGEKVAAHATHHATLDALTGLAGFGGRGRGLFG